MSRDNDVANGEDQQGAAGDVESSGKDSHGPGSGAPNGNQDDARDAPVGAIAVTTFLAITILVFWFGMYFLNIARSS